MHIRVVYSVCYVWCGRKYIRWLGNEFSFHSFDKYFCSFTLVGLSYLFGFCNRKGKKVIHKVPLFPKKFPLVIITHFFRFYLFFVCFFFTHFLWIETKIKMKTQKEETEWRTKWNGTSITFDDWNKQKENIKRFERRGVVNRIESSAWALACVAIANECNVCWLTNRYKGRHTQEELHCIFVSCSFFLLFVFLFIQHRYLAISLRRNFRKTNFSFLLQMQKNQMEEKERIEKENIIRCKLIK